MSVRHIMTTPIVTVDMDDNLRVIREIFSKSRFHHLLVVENDKLYGVISDRDLLKEISPRLGTAAEKPEDSASLYKKAHQIMSRRPIVIGQNDSIHRAIDLFEEHSISCIPVVDDEGYPVGILSWRDIFKAIRRNRPGRGC